jgi:hypothetical protein
MLTHVVRGPICHAFSEPKQGRPDNEIEPNAIAERDKAQSLASIAAAVGLAQRNVRPPECLAQGR